MRLTATWCISLFLFAAGVVAGEPLRLAGEGIVLEARDDGTLALLVDGQAAARLNHLRVDGQKLRSGAAEFSVPEPGRLAGRFGMLKDGQPAPDFGLEIEARVQGPAARLVYRISAPGDWKPGNAMVARVFGAPVDAASRARRHPTVWERHRHGGVPFETDQGAFFIYGAGEGRRLFERTRGYHAFCGDQAIHLGLRKEAGADVWTATYDLVLLPDSANEDEALARLENRPFALTLATDKPFALFSPADRTLPVSATLAGTPGAAPAAVRLSWTGRDYDGAIHGEGEKAVELGGGARTTETLEFPGFPEDRGMVFVEVRAQGLDAEGRPLAGAEEVFARTRLSVLPAHEYRNPHPVFGMAAWFPMPTQEAALELMKRMGVRRVRNGDGRVTEPFGIAAARHVNKRSTDFKDDPGARLAYFRDLVKECAENRNAHLEWGNEWNMAGISGRKPNPNTDLCRVYSREWLPALARAKREAGADLKVLSMGLAAGDIRWLEDMKEFGGWDLIDGVAYHPGRGNVVPDYVPAAAYETKGWERWNFLGALRDVRQAVEKLGGGKEIWITEAYACTQPNSSWHDSERHAAENVPLSYALALSEKVDAMFWYQLNDSVWHAHGVVRPADKEYYFGLTSRDGGNLKPSALSYAAAAEHLDGARFVRWGEFKDPDVKGLWFDTPRGPLAVLWLRADGYRQAGRKPNYAAPEPWQDHWKTKREVTLPLAKGAEARVFDVLGRQAKPARERPGQVALTLDGAARFVYGLAPDGEE